MNNSSDKLTCMLGCWLVASLTGFMAAAMLIVVADWSVLQALFVAAVIFFVGGALISWLICKPLPPMNAGVQEATKPAAKPAPAPKPEADAAAPAAAPVVVKSSQLPGQDELAERKGEWKYDANSDDAPAPAAPAAEETPTAEPTGEAAPETLTEARAGGPDDLKLLKGVGPKLEQTLNELGFFHFDQIAKWTDAEVAWVDTRLKFKGRIERDGWIDQAKILAAGGETEFSARKK